MNRIDVDRGCDCCTKTPRFIIPLALVLTLICSTLISAQPIGVEYELTRKAPARFTVNGESEHYYIMNESIFTIIRIDRIDFTFGFGGQTMEIRGVTDYDLELKTKRFQQWLRSGVEEGMYIDNVDTLILPEFDKDFIDVLEFNDTESGFTDSVLLVREDSSTLHLTFRDDSLPPVHVYNIHYPEITHLPVAITNHSGARHELVRVITDPEEINSLLAGPDQSEYIEYTEDDMDFIMREIWGTDDKDEFIQMVDSLSKDEKFMRQFRRE